MDSIYCDSIYRYLIPYNKISSENLTCALKFAKRIKLDEAQYEYLMSCALRMAHRLEKAPLTNVWNEEFDILEKSLTYKQLQSMLILKHKKQYRRRWIKFGLSWKRLILLMGLIVRKSILQLACI